MFCHLNFSLISCFLCISFLQSVYLLKIEDSRYESKIISVNINETEKLIFCNEETDNYPCIASMTFLNKIISNSNMMNSEVFKMKSNNFQVQLNITTNATSYKIYEDFDLHSTTLVKDNLKVKLIIQCAKGYKGNTCDEFDLCKLYGNDLCQNNGTCLENDDGKLNCQCQSRFKGKYCQEIKDKCSNNSCLNKAKCLNNATVDIGYECECKPEYDGKFCEKDVDECERNSTICSAKPGSTCINLYGSHQCSCLVNCTQSRTTTIIPTTTIMPTSTPTSLRPITTNDNNGISNLNWPLSNLLTIILFIILLLIIIVLIIVIIILQVKCCRSGNGRPKSYMDDSLLDGNVQPRLKTDNLELGSAYARKPVASDDYESRRSLTPIYDLQDFNTINDPQNNDAINDDYTNNPGMSTFGRRHN